MAKKKIPFLKPGTFTAQNGETLKVDESDLDLIVEATKKRNYQNNQLPIVIGHPKTDDPAFGWVNKADIVREGDVLYAVADESNLVPEFVEWVKKKLYKTISPAIRGDLSIKHIGFLGAKAPAITGLPALEFNENDEEFVCEFAEYEFSPWYFKTVSRMFRRIKNYIIEKEGNEKADALINEYEIDELSTPPRIWEKTPVNNFSEKDNTFIHLSEDEMQSLEALQAQIAELTATAEAQAAQIAALTSEKTAVINEANSLKMQQRRSEFLNFCESDEVKNKIKDGERAELIETLLVLDSVEAFEFGEGDEKKTISPVETVKGLIKRLPDVVALGEHATNKTAGDDTSDVDVSEFAEKNVDQEGLELHKKVLRLQRKENLTYEEALKKVRSTK